MIDEKAGLSAKEKEVAVMMFLNTAACDYLASVKRMTNKLRNQMKDLQAVASEGLEVFVAGKKFDELTEGIEHLRSVILEKVGLIRVEKQLEVGGIVSRIEFAPEQAAEENP